MREFGEEGLQIALGGAAGDFEGRSDALKDLLAIELLAQRLHDEQRRRACSEKFARRGIKAKTVRLPGDGVEIEGGKFSRWNSQSGLMGVAVVTDLGGRSEFHGCGWLNHIA